MPWPTSTSLCKYEEEKKNASLHFKKDDEKHFSLQSMLKNLHLASYIEPTTPFTYKFLPKLPIEFSFLFLAEIYFSHVS